MCIKKSISLLILVLCAGIGLAACPDQLSPGMIACEDFEDDNKLDTFGLGNWWDSEAYCDCLEGNDSASWIIQDSCTYNSTVINPIDGDRFLSGQWKPDVIDECSGQSHTSTCNNNHLELRDFDTGYCGTDLDYGSRIDSEFFIRYWLKLPGEMPPTQYHAFKIIYLYPGNMCLSVYPNEDNLNSGSWQFYSNQAGTNWLINWYVGSGECEDVEPTPVCRPPFADGEWHKAELYYKIGSGDQAQVKFWCDDALILDTDVEPKETYYDQPFNFSIIRPNNMGVMYNDGSRGFFDYDSPWMMDDLELWGDVNNTDLEGMRDGTIGEIPECGREITSSCYCNGTLRDSGYCCNDVWNQDACLLIDYGFEDWTGDAQTTPGYVFSSIYGESHTNTTEVVTECQGWTAAEGDYFFYGNWYYDIFDGCLGNYGGGPHAIMGSHESNSGFDLNTALNGSNTTYVNYKVILGPGWRNNTNMPVKFQRMKWAHGPYADDYSNIVMYDGTDNYMSIMGRESPWTGLQHLHDYGINLSDGAWHDFAVFVNITGLFETPIQNISGKVWVDGIKVLDRVMDINEDYIAEYGSSGFESLNFLSNFCGTTNDGEVRYGIDSIKVWDDIPSRGYHEADSNQDGEVDNGEIRSYVDKWVGGTVDFGDLVTGLSQWKEDV